MKRYVCVFAFGSKLPAHDLAFWYVVSWRFANYTTGDYARSDAPQGYTTSKAGGIWFMALKPGAIRAGAIVNLHSAVSQLTPGSGFGKSRCWTS